MPKAKTVPWYVAVVSGLGVAVIAGYCGRSSGLDSARIREEGETTRQAISIRESQTAEARHAGQTETVEARPTRCPCGATVTLTRPSGPTPSPTPPTSALDTVLGFYHRLNAGQFLAAWDLLTDNYRTVENPRGFDTFVAYWRETPVEVLEVREKYEALTSAEYQVRLRFVKDGQEGYYDLSLVSDGLLWWINAESNFTVSPD